MKRIKGLTVALALGLMAAHAGNAAALEKKKVTLGVGGQVGTYYMAMTLADALGFFKEQGLEVEINDFAGGAKSLQALVGGSVDVVTGAHEHTIRMQQKGQDILSIIELGRYPGISLIVRKERAKDYKSAADLKGWKIGVSAPGSSTNMIVWSLMTKAGLQTTDASFIGVGVGQTAYAALQKGEIDAVSTVEPIASKMVKDGIGVMVAETSTPEGAGKVLGGPMSAATLYTRRDFIEKNPQTAQALVNALYKSLLWMKKSTPEEIIAKVPAKFLPGDKEVVLAAVTTSKATFSETGNITPETLKRSLDFLKGFDKALAAANVDANKTWDGRFVKVAAEKIK